MNDNADEMNVAATLRDIAAACNKTTGRILRQCEKAANEGKSSIIVKVSPEDHEGCCPDKSKWTPMIERLVSLGFACQRTFQKTFWSISHNLIKVSW